MKSMYKRNISAAGRWASTAAGAALAAAGYRRSNRALSLLGLGFVARGVSGWCPVTAAIERDSAEYEEATKQYLSGAGGIMVEDVITIYRPINEVYAYWRNVENLPRFMEHLEEVRENGRFRSHWMARGPLGVIVEWDAEIINDIPPTLLSWKSVGDSDVVSAGSVRFKALGDQSTLVSVKLQYDPPAGKLGAGVAWLLGEDPQRQIANDLRRFKQALETGEAEADVPYRTPRSTERTTRELDISELSTDYGSTR